MRTYSCKTNKLRNVYIIGRGARIISSKKKKINYFKILVETMPFIMDEFKSKKGLQFLKDLPYSTEVQWDLSDFPLHIFIIGLVYLYMGLKARNPVFKGLRTTKAQTSLRIHAVC